MIFILSEMSNLSGTRSKCLNCVDDFMSRSDLSNEYKERRVGQAISYLKEAKSMYEREGYNGPYIKDDRGRCHAESNEGGYFKGQFVPCPEEGNVGQSRYSSRDRAGNYGSRGRVGQASYGFGDRQGYTGRYEKDDRGRCHALEYQDGYRPGQFIPCPEEGNVGQSRYRSRDRVGNYGSRDRY